MSEANRWGRFYQTLNRLGPRLLTGIPDGLEQYIREEAEGSDAFWSSSLEHDFSYWREGDRERAVRLGLEDWVQNVRQHLTEIFGDDSLIPFESKGVTRAERMETIESIQGIDLRLDEAHLRLFIDSVLIGAESEERLLVQCVVYPYGRNSEGELIHAVSLPWRKIVSELRGDWSKACQVSSRQWEEIIAAAFDEAGYDEVVLTPRSNDGGRDVIATKNGIGAIRIIDSVKAYRLGKPVRHDDVRALAGVLLGDLRASKGIVTTTSTFAPGIANDPFLKPLIPYRLELMDGVALQKWLEDLALS